MLRQLVRKIPFAVDTYAALRLLRGGRKGRFASDYGKNSGAGADLVSTARIVQAIPALLRELDVRRLLDVPCGDFNWMGHIDLSGIQYVGGDILDSMVERNRQRHAGEGRQFSVIDLVTDPLPPADVMLCRDCLTHFSPRLLRQAIRNVKRAPVTYLLTTTFPSHPRNRSIVTGNWRPLNLCAPPFNFPPPMRLIAEGHPAPYQDKSLGLWRIEELPDL